MGIIRHAEKAPTNIVYKVDDMTAAPMDVRQWVDTDVSGCFRVGLLWGFGEVELLSHFVISSCKNNLQARYQRQRPCNERLIHLVSWKFQMFSISLSS